MVAKRVKKTATAEANASDPTAERCEWEGSKEWPTMLLQPGVHFVTINCIQSWKDVKLRFETRNLPLPVEVGLAPRDTSVHDREIPQPQKDVSPRPLQIPMPRIGPQSQGAVGGSCAMNRPT